MYTDCPEVGNSIAPEGAMATKSILNEPPRHVYEGEKISEGKDQNVTDEKSYIQRNKSTLNGPLRNFHEYEIITRWRVEKLWKTF